MKPEKPLVSLKQKIAIAFYLVVLMTISIGVVAIILSQGLKFKVDHLVTEDMLKVTTALNLAKDAHKLQTITAKLDITPREDLKQYENQRRNNLDALEIKWQELLDDSRQLASLSLSLAFKQQLEQHIDRQLHYVQQMSLIKAITERALSSHIQAYNLQTNLINIQNSFAKDITAKLRNIDTLTSLALDKRQIRQAKSLIKQHEELARFLHYGEQLFAQLAQLSPNENIPKINQLQRTSMRLYLIMDASFTKEDELYPLAQNWLSLIQENIIGEDNIFLLTRDAKKSHNIASAHLSYQASAAQDISEFAQRLVSHVELSIEKSRQKLKTDSTAFVVLIIFAGIIYAFFVWLTNWHFISKGIIKPVIATSHAMNAIANEKLDTQLPRTDNLELHQMVTSLETLKSYAAQVKAVSEIDGLTGVYNRRYFDQQLTTLISRCNEQQLPLSLILFDIDKFKQYNDKYGHLAGDQCLKRVLRTVKSQLHRPADMIARYGGDEFVILLPNTLEQDALTIAEKIRIKVFDLAIPHADSDYDNRITISLGVASMLCTGINTSDALIQYADKALYQAKADGRNRSSS